MCSRRLRRRRTWRAGRQCGRRTYRGLCERTPERVRIYRDHAGLAYRTGDHWSEHPDFVDTWPVHGKAGTANAELHPAIAALNIEHHSRKASIRHHIPASKASRTTPTASPPARKSPPPWPRARHSTRIEDRRHHTGRCSRPSRITLRQRDRSRRKKAGVRSACHRKPDRTGQ